MSSSPSPPPSSSSSAIQNNKKKWTTTLALCVIGTVLITLAPNFGNNSSGLRGLSNNGINNNAGSSLLQGNTVVVAVADKPPTASCPCWSYEQLEFSACQFSVTATGIETTRLIIQAPDGGVHGMHNLFQAQAGHSLESELRLKNYGNAENEINNFNDNDESSPSYYTCHYHETADEDARPLTMPEYEACAAQLVHYCLAESKAQGPTNPLVVETADENPAVQDAAAPVVDVKHQDNSNDESDDDEQSASSDCPCWPQGLAHDIGFDNIPHNLEQSCESQLSHPHQNKYRIHYAYECSHDSNNKPCQAVVRQDFDGHAYCAHQAAHTDAPLVHIQGLTDHQLAACYSDLVETCQRFAEMSFLVSHA